MYKVLVVAYYFPPIGLSGVQRTLKFVKYLPEFGWQPTIITSGNIAYFAHDTSLLKEIKPNTKIIRIEGNEPNSKLKNYGTIQYPREKIRKLFNRISQTFYLPDNKKSWSINAKEAVEQELNSERYDIVFITAPPFSAFSEIVKLKAKFEIPFVFDYRDLWFESYFSFYPTPMHKKYINELEYATVRNADLVTVTNRNIKEKLIKNYPYLNHSRVEIISHGYDQEDFDCAPTAKKNTNKLLFVHSGNFIEYTTPKYLLKSLVELKQMHPDVFGDIEIHLVGILDKSNKKRIKKYGLDEVVKVFGYLEHSEVISKIKGADVLWFMISERKNIDAILPGKVFEYVGARKPIFANIPQGAAENVLEEYKGSYITSPYNIKEIVEKIVEIHSDYKKNNFPKIDLDYVEMHDRKLLTELLAKKFQFLMRLEE
jgi:hypothetical protein